MHRRYRLRKQQLLDECEVPPEVFRGGIERLAEFARPFAECLVRRECLRYAISKNEDHGVWGGMTRDERIQVRWQAGDPPSGRPLPGRL